MGYTSIQNASVIQDNQEGRRAARYGVELNCRLSSRYWGTPVAHRVLELSPYGAWVDTSFPLRPGEKAVLDFAVPGRIAYPRFKLLTRVSRVQMRRGTSDDTPMGMALEFLDILPNERREIVSFLSQIALESENENDYEDAASLLDE